MEFIIKLTLIYLLTMVINFVGKECNILTTDGAMLISVVITLIVLLVACFSGNWAILWMYFATNLATSVLKTDK